MGSASCNGKNLTMNDFIPVNQPYLEGNELKYLSECITSGWISSEGPYVERFEQEIANYVGRKYAIAVTNGTAAIDASIEALGISKDDEIIMPTFAIISCVAQIIRNGAKPVFIDSDPNTWNMNVSEIESKITPKTKAIMIVHTYGLAVDINPVLEICRKYSLRLIEDAAEAIGLKYGNSQCGSFGDISIFSFYPNKHITTGEGGMILTDDENLAQKCKSLRNLSFRPNDRFVHDELGWNLRITNMQAAIGVAQLEKIEETIEKKIWIGEKYNYLLKDLSSIQLPVTSAYLSKNLYWVYGIVIKDGFEFDAKEAIRRLQELNIGCRPFFYPLHKQPVFEKMKLFLNENYPIAENLYKMGFYIPSGIGISEYQIHKVSEALTKVFMK